MLRQSQRCLGIRSNRLAERLEGVVDVQEGTRSVLSGAVCVSGRVATEPTSQTNQLKAMGS